MKIALVIYHYSETRGGAERVAHNLVRGLLRAGHKVHIFAHEVSADPAAGLHFHTVPVLSFYSPLKHLTFAKNVKKMLQQEQFDIIHSFARTYYQDIYRIGGGTHREYLNNMNATRPTIARWFNTCVNPKERLILKLEKRSFAPTASRKIVSVSQRCKREIIEHYGVPKDKIAVFYNGVDTEVFHPRNKAQFRAPLRRELGIVEDECVFLFAGSGFRRKGLEHALAALDLLPKNLRFKLLIAGRGATAPFQKQAERARISDRILFLGERQNIHEFYAASDVFILPSLYDPFPNACMEALATGIPVITTQVTGVSEILTSGRDSFVIEKASDVQELAEKAKTLITNPDLCARMSLSARRTAEQYSIEKYLAANLALYGEVAAQKKSALVR